jgi:hypothetical protein
MDRVDFLNQAYRSNWQKKSELQVSFSLSNQAMRNFRPSAKFDSCRWAIRRVKQIVDCSNVLATSAIWITFTWLCFNLLEKLTWRSKYSNLCGLTFLFQVELYERQMGQKAALVQRQDEEDEEDNENDQPSGGQDRRSTILASYSTRTTLSEGLQPSSVYVVEVCPCFKNNSIWICLVVCQRRLHWRPIAGRIYNSCFENTSVSIWTRFRPKSTWITITSSV